MAAALVGEEDGFKIGNVVAHNDWGFLQDKTKIEKKEEVMRRWYLL